MTKPTKLTVDSIGSLLVDLWKRQAKHNGQVKLVENRTPEEWVQTYLLGITSEIGELLQEVNWKVHVKQRIDWDSKGALLELADITKYVFSLWIHLGITPEEMLQWVELKSDVVEHRFWHEWNKPPIGKTIIISDLDGSIADWRKGFEDWALSTNSLSKADLIKSLNADLDNGWTYNAYAETRKAFDFSGGHLLLPPFEDGIKFIHEAQEVGALLYVVTARPNRPNRIFYDTYQWLKAQEVAPEWVYFVDNARVALALELSKRNTVIALEDNPDLALRYAANGIKTIVRRFSYNSHLEDKKNIWVTDDFLGTAKALSESFGIQLRRRWHHEKV